jgi:hypothetical protein
MSGPPRTSLEAALAYRSVGWSVLPTEEKLPHAAALVHTSGSAEWKRLQATAPSEDEIRKWYASYPDAGVGIITGAVSGDLAVLDFDRRPRTPVRFPSTPLVRTPRGRHIYLAGPAGLNGRRFGDGELIAGGQYVVAPPSWTDGFERHWLIAPDGLGSIAVPDELLADFWPVAGPVLTANAVPDGRADAGTDICSCVQTAANEAVDDLAAWDSDPGFVAAVCRLLGLPSRIGRSFRCILPGHPDRHASASLYAESRQGSVRYHDWHSADPSQEWWWLAEVFAAVVSGRLLKLRGPELARWKLRLLAVTGFVLLPHLALPPIPADAPHRAVQVYDGFRLLLQCRGVREPVGSPTPFTRDFGSRWCGMNESAFDRGKSWLIKRGLIRPAGKYGPRGRETTLWRPGRVS